MTLISSLIYFIIILNWQTRFIIIFTSHDCKDLLDESKAILKVTLNVIYVGKQVGILDF